MKNFVKWFGVIALVAVIGFSMVSCGGDDSGGGGNGGQTPGGSGSKPFTTIAAFGTWLAAQPTNTSTEPYVVKLNISDLGGDVSTNGSVGKILSSYNNDQRKTSSRYVSLDLSGSSLTSIGDYTFEECYGLTSVTLPDGVINIGEYAFSGCYGLTSVTIPDSVTSIGNVAFGNCTGLDSVTIGNSVASIGMSAFSQCGGLTSVTIPSSVTSIGMGAFDRCYDLISVTFATGSNITYANFGSDAFPNRDGEGRDGLKGAYYTGKAGTYTRDDYNNTWKKQP